jgi:hypothetical protein
LPHPKTLPPLITLAAAAFVGVSAAAAGAAAAPATRPAAQPPREVAKLIEKLSSPNAEARDAAAGRLTAEAEEAAEEAAQAKKAATRPGAGLSPEERAAVVSAATDALRHYHHTALKDRKGDEFPEKTWGEAISRLKPVRVRYDRANVMIVMKEDERSEEGLYVATMISSYTPGRGGEFATFKKLSEPGDKSAGELYRYVIDKTKRKAGDAKGARERGEFCG